MASQRKNDNAANRKSYIGDIFNEGEKIIKKNVLDNFNPIYSNLHKNAYIHIHDLDAFDLTYNCLTFDLTKSFPFKKFQYLNPIDKIISFFNHLIEMLEKMGNEQSGGMSIPNFDCDLDYIFSKMKVNIVDYKDVFSSCIKNFIIWNNNNHTRMGQTSYYVTLNIGLSTTIIGRFISMTLLNEFMNSSSLIYKPNIVFKVKKGINFFESDPNYDILIQSLKCTAIKMIPTYVLCDSESNKNNDPYQMAIVGCRTRVWKNIHGKNTSIGRGNIANISINLPRLALEVNDENPNKCFCEKINILYDKWEEIADNCKDILIEKIIRLSKVEKSNFPSNLEYEMWLVNFENNTLFDIFKQSTLSIGFIGLSEAIEIISGTKYWKNKVVYNHSLNFIKRMREFTDTVTDKTNFNFSLLATSGELISGRFLEEDRKKFASNVFEKGYYTNSFHIDVDSNLPAYKKIILESKFHNYCNGGCITYVELREAPIGNYLGLLDLLKVGIESGTHYLGFNFPKDICSLCSTSGVFDVCPVCDSKNIIRIRRVSGYLEIENFFTNGKKNETLNRKVN